MVSRKLTAPIALSIAVDAPPPRDMETTDGRPEAAAWEITQFKPLTLI